MLMITLSNVNTKHVAIISEFIEHEQDEFERSNSIFILGYFDYYGIEINKNDENAFNLFINASEKNHILAQYFIAVDKNFTPGQVSIGYCYEKGIGVEKDLKKAFYWYEIAANNGSLMAILY
ncbi:kinase-like domain-containing protein [Rhizophagus irregularis DAOM 181602=DAOM 197198]|nr:kinase-like domain-containing protein [Rhizophagus irregularis DAOM 181602=DAOM 197198]